MNPDSHDRARQLMVAARIEEIAPAERGWLQNHLASCPDCSKQATALDAAIRSLRALHVTASPELVDRTSRAVRGRAEQMEAERRDTTLLWIATAVTAVFMVGTAPYVWQAFGWFGRIAQIPDPAWQLGFLVWWFLPATVLAGAAAWKHTAKEMNWGHQ
jgi:anti-sigma factor RsiW